TSPGSPPNAPASALRAACSIPGVGSPAQELKYATARGSDSPSLRSERTTPARSNELLPTPLGPHRTVSREASALAATISVSRSRPKKNKASSSLSSNGLSPLYGVTGTTGELTPTLPGLLPRQAARVGVRRTRRIRSSSARRRGASKIHARG